MELTDSLNWNYEFDVVVIGSGNGAMTTGLVAHDHDAKVVLIEKSDKYGGTSASSGGGVWIPNNRYAKEAKAIDSIQDAKTYIQYVSPKGKIKEELIDVYLEKGPEMIDYLHDNSRVRYQALENYPD